MTNKRHELSREQIEKLRKARKRDRKTANPENSLVNILREVNEAHRHGQPVNAEYR